MAKTFIASVVAASVLSLSLAPHAQAAVIGTDAVVSAPSSTVTAQASAAHARILSLLSRDGAVAALTERGVSPADAQARVASLTDAEAQALLQQIDEAPAGAANALAIVAGVAVILMITDLLGFTRIFPFIKPIR